MLCVTSQSERGNKHLLLSFTHCQVQTVRLFSAYSPSSLFLYISSLFFLHVFVCVFQTRCFHAVWHVYSIRIMQLMCAAVINTLLFCSHSRQLNISVCHCRITIISDICLFVCVCECVQCNIHIPHG